MAGWRLSSTWTNQNWAVSKTHNCCVQQTDDTDTACWHLRSRARRWGNLRLVARAEEVTNQSCGCLCCHRPKLTGLGRRGYLSISESLPVKNSQRWSHISPILWWHPKSNLPTFFLCSQNEFKQNRWYARVTKWHPNLNKPRQQSQGLQPNQWKTILETGLICWTHTGPLALCTCGAAAGTKKSHWYQHEQVASNTYPHGDGQNHLDNGLLWW